MTILFGDSPLNETEFPVLSDSEEERMSSEFIPEELGILPLKNTVLYPGVVIPITVGRDKSIKLVNDALRTSSKLVGVVAQRKASTEDPTPEDLFSKGTVARILKRFKMPDGSITIVIQGRSRFEISEITQTKPYFKARVKRLPEIQPDENQAQAMVLSLKQEANRIIEIAPNIPSEANTAIQNISSLSLLIHFISSNLTLDVPGKQEILVMDDLLEKGEKVLEYMSKELAILELTEEIQSKVKTDLDQQQREYFLRQQMKAIQDELGGDDGPDSDVENFKKRAAEKKWPEKVQQVFDKEVRRLSRLMPTMPDYSVISNYLDWLLELPWADYSEDRIDLALAQKVLDDDHYGLEKVKDRILEQLAVFKLKADMKSPILCFFGPPGVGKTSLGKSIARAMNREFIRISLGGMRDEAEIRGHRRTYIGAMPGRIIQGLKKAKTGNPILMLDEIDKVGNDFRGDPSSALLEVLDPEQNFSFQDHFLEVEYDLSHIMFIATANTLSTIHPALRDRMEIIEINGYSQEEKLEIAKQYLVPEQRKEHGLKPTQLKIADAAIKATIDKYTRESGVRNLAQQVARVCRVAAKQVVENPEAKITVNQKNLEDFLGVPRFETEIYKQVDSPGVAIGLAWTPVGGDILFIETTLTRGSGKLMITGQLGDVMKESATLAYTYFKANADQYSISHEIFKHWDLHLHCPAGAIPKDGPSAGVSIMTAMASIFTQRRVTPALAMTGEITLRGKVLPVGGIKEKVLAARRAGINTVLLPKDNRKDVSEIKAEYLSGIKVHYVEEMRQVLDFALEGKPVDNPMDLLPPELINKSMPGTPGNITFQA
ncbi:MAG: endopeptidase La [Bacteroidia bacterium]|nr:endopeptidase La [Bacteroidia bacterium]